MTSIPEPKPKVGLGSFRIMLLVCAASVGCCFLGGFAYLRYYTAARMAERRLEVERIRKQGLPTDLAELDRFYLTDAEAAQLGTQWVNALANFNVTWETYDDVPFFERLGDLGDPPAPEDVVVLRALLADNAGYLDEIRRLVAIPHEVRYPLDFSKGLELEFPFAPDVRLAVRMFAADAQIAALDGDVERVVQDCIFAVKTGETVQDAPILILQLLRSACQMIAFRHLEYAVNAITIPDKDIKQLREVVQQLDFDGATAHGMIGEMCLADVSLFLEQAEGYSRFAKFLRRYREFPDMWSANLFLANSELMRIGDLPPWKRYQAAEEVNQRIMSQWMLFHIFEQLLTPAIGRAFEVENGVLGTIAITHAGLAVLEFARTEGTLPENLSVLVPGYLDSIPRDPFDGEPVRYCRTETGFVVYSIAPNRLDDGGVPPPEDKKVTQTGDLVFRVLDASPYLKEAV